jgi:hypothetical protein
MQDSVYGRMYYSHDLLFLWIAATMEGKFSEAKQAANELSANVSPAVQSMPMLEALLGGPALVLARFQRWDDILNLPAPGASLAGARAYWRYSRGVAFSAKGAISKAEAERQELAALVNQPTSAASSGRNSAPSFVPLALEVLDARIAAAQADHKASLAYWRRAVEMQDALPYNEPPDWYYPVRESLGGELARAGQYAGSRSSVSRRPPTQSGQPQITLRLVADAHGTEQNRSIPLGSAALRKCLEVCRGNPAPGGFVMQSAWSRRRFLELSAGFPLSALALPPDEELVPFRDYGPDFRVAAQRKSSRQMFRLRRRFRRNPTEEFYEFHQTQTPRADAGAWRLRINGHVKRPPNSRCVTS